MPIVDIITGFHELVVPSVITIRGVPEMKVVGSVRRLLSANKEIPEQIHDVEFVIASNPATLAHFDRLVSERKIEKAGAWGDKFRKLKYKNVKFDIFFHVPENRGYITWLRTGPSDANQWFVTFVKNNAPFVLKGGFIWTTESCVFESDKDEKGKERGMFVPNKHSVKVVCGDEREWFRLWGMPYIYPHMRENLIYQTYMTVGHAFGKATQFIYPPTAPPTQGGLF